MGVLMLESFQLLHKSADDRPECTRACWFENRRVFIKTARLLSAISDNMGVRGAIRGEGAVNFIFFPANGTLALC